MPSTKAARARADATLPTPLPLQTTGPPVALYVHVPFCVSHCPYCDFVVVAGRGTRGPENRLAAFVAALEVELRLRAEALDARWGPIEHGPPGDRSTGDRPPLASLYFGGGTPSLLPASTIARLIGLVREGFGLVDDAEVTIEANPGPDERGDMAAFCDAGVTRLSIGAQSFDTAELRALGRRHAPGDIDATVRAAREAGIPSVSIDLLYDVPEGTLGAWERSLDRALRLEPDHLSLYALTLDDPESEGLTGPAGDHLPVRSGARRWRDRARTGQDDDRAAAMYELADRRLAAEGYDWYEISNWARRGHRSRHNLAYWRRSPYEAVGPGAHAFDGDARRWNAARLDGYIEALTPVRGGAPTLPPGGSEPGDAAGAGFEAEMLALRTADGLAPSSAVEVRLAEPIAAGLLERARDGRLSLTLRGRLLANEVFARLLPS